MGRLLAVGGGVGVCVSVKSSCGRLQYGCPIIILAYNILVRQYHSFFGVLAIKFAT